MIDKRWSEIARRAVAGLGVQPGELVQVQEHAGRPEVLQEMLLAVEAAGATPWPDLGPPAKPDQPAQRLSLSSALPLRSG